MVYTTEKMHVTVCIETYSMYALYNQQPLPTKVQCMSITSVTVRHDKPFHQLSYHYTSHSLI
uniref:Uncharacterized protein n=1 Tax=Arundo donax TaxID=35708 RepID=A0A0A9AU96_ARUDO